MSGFYVISGPIMYLPKARRCKASITLWTLVQKNRVKEAGEEEDTIQPEGYRDQRGAGTTATNDR